MIIDKVIGLLDSDLTLEELDMLPPARRQKLAQLLRHWTQLAEMRQEQQPRSGVLPKLKDGERSE